MVTIRIPHEDYEGVYLPFKDLVTKKLGSDVCYTTVSLFRAFLNAMGQASQEPDQVEIKFLRQNVQINMGCTFTYEVKKRRRAAETHFPEEILTDRDNLLPKVVDQYSNIAKQARDYWFKIFVQEGIIKQPRVSTGTRKPRVKKIFRWSI